MGYCKVFFTKELAREKQKSPEWFRGFLFFSLSIIADGVELIGTAFVLD
jgi:hypothetical protein